MTKQAIPAIPSPCNEDNSIKDLIDNLIDNSTITPIKTPHEIAIEKLSEAESLLNDAILQFEAAKLSVHNATTAPQPVVNMDVIDLESEAIRVAAIEAQQALALRTAELVLTARRQRVQNAIQAVKNAVEAVNEEVSILLQNRMKILENNLSPMLSGLNEFRQVAASLGWRSGSLSEAAECIERDYVLDLPEIDLPRRVPLPDCLAAADTALSGPTAPRPLDGTLNDRMIYPEGCNSSAFKGDVQDLLVAGREKMRIDSIIEGIVERHDRARFNSDLKGMINITLPPMGHVHAY